ncbi:MAG: glutathione S-transferase domain-containing protein [Nostoc sp. DedQUE11]|nr:glutathione S-transferase domain-containing protein [Nostoc sp. DedQUE11]
MLPKDAKDLAIARMVQLLTVNDLLPTNTTFLPQILGLPGAEPKKIEQAKQKISTVLKFLESLLDNRPYFGSENLTLAEAVAGTVVIWLPRVGIFLNDYPKLSAWCDRLREPQKINYSNFWTQHNCFLPCPLPTQRWNIFLL